MQHVLAAGANFLVRLLGWDSPRMVSPNETRIDLASLHGTLSSGQIIAVPVILTRPSKGTKRLSLRLSGIWALPEAFCNEISRGSGTSYTHSSLSLQRQSQMQIDPLSDVLSLLRPHTQVAGGFDLRGRWSIGFEPHSGIKCYAVLSGRCWAVVNDVADPVALEAGDCVLLPNGRRFYLTNQLSRSPVPFADLRPVEWRGDIATVYGGGETLILGGHFAFSGAHADVLLGAMPPIAHLSEDRDKEELRWAPPSGARWAVRHDSTPAPRPSLEHTIHGALPHLARQRIDQPAVSLGSSRLVVSAAAVHLPAEGDEHEP